VWIIWPQRQQVDVWHPGDAAQPVPSILTRRLMVRTSFLASPTLWRVSLPNRVFRRLSGHAPRYSSCPLRDHATGIFSVLIMAQVSEVITDSNPSAVVSPLSDREGAAFTKLW
jgi:hypothetical protein